MANLLQLRHILAEKEHQHALLVQELCFWASERVKLEINIENLRRQVEFQRNNLRSCLWDLEEIVLANKNEEQDNEALRDENRRLALEIQLVTAKIQLRIAATPQHPPNVPDEQVMPQLNTTKLKDPIGTTIKRWMKRTVLGGAIITFGILLALPLLDPGESCGCGEKAVLSTK